MIKKAFEGSRKLKSRVYAALNMVVNSIKKMNKWNKKKRNHPMDLANKLVLSVGILKTNKGYARAARTCTYFRVTLCNTTTWIKMSPRQCFHVKHFFLFGEKRYVNAALKYFYLLLKNHLLGHSIVTSACLCWVEMYAQKKPTLLKCFYLSSTVYRSVIITMTLKKESLDNGIVIRPVWM